MSKIKYYDARILKGDTVESISVNVKSLPYGKFGKGCPLFIKSDVVVENGKKKTLPDFSNVIILGAFDCSSYVITPESVLPEGISVLKCLHSINNLDDLLNKLPTSVQKVIVRHSLLNDVKRNKSQELDAAKRFIASYPKVEVISDKNVSLLDVIKETEKDKTVVVERNNKAKNSADEIVVEFKTADWLSNDEVVQFYKNSADKSTKFTDEDIERAVRVSKGRKSHLNLEKRELIRADGAIVSCVRCDDMPKIIEFIQNYLVCDTVKAKKALVTGSKQKTEQVAKQDAAPKYYFVGDKEVQETTIKKYIKNSVWKAISNHCKNDLDKKLAFLQAIESINVRPVDTAGKKVCFIEDNSLKISPTVTFKNAQWLSQGFGTLDDRARIIWCMNEHGFIATEYFEEHEKKQSVAYKQAIRDKEINRFTLYDTVAVSDLIQELTAERDAKISAEEMSAKTVVEIAEEAPVKKQVRQRIHRDVKPAKATTVNPNADKIKSKVMVLGDVEQLSSHNDDATQDTGVVLEPESDKNKIVWTDIDSVHAAFMVKVQGLNTEKAELLAKLTSETNTDDALGYTQQLQKVLCDKKKYETVLNKLNVMQQELQQIKQDFSNQM